MAGGDVKHRAETGLAMTAAVEAEHELFHKQLTPTAVGIPTSAYVTTRATDVYYEILVSPSPFGFPVLEATLSKPDRALV